MYYTWDNKGHVIGIGTSRNVARETAFKLVKNIGKRSVTLAEESNVDDAFRLYMNAQFDLANDIKNGNAKACSLEVQQVKKYGTYEGDVATPKISWSYSDPKFIKGISLKMVDGKLIRESLRH